MTCPAVIQGCEQWNRWLNPNHSPMLTSEALKGRNRMLGGGIRLLPMVRYGVIVLALCLLLSDSFRLAFSAGSSQRVTPKTQPVRSARTVHGIPTAQPMGAKRHSGV
jgi:hypothetical protein